MLLPIMLPTVQQLLPVADCWLLTADCWLLEPVSSRLTAGACRLTAGYWLVGFTGMFAVESWLETNPVSSPRSLTKTRHSSYFWNNKSLFNDFTESAPLGRFGHRDAMSVCLFVCLCAPSGAIFLPGLSLALMSHDQFTIYKFFNYIFIVCKHKKKTIQPELKPWRFNNKGNTLCMSLHWFEREGRDSTRKRLILREIL